MPVGGIIVLDDCDFSSIRKLCRLLSKFDFLEICYTQKKIKNPCTKKWQE